MDDMEKTKKIAIVTNIPSPYRVDLFYYLSTNFKNYKWYIVYASRNFENRQWTIDEKKMINTFFLSSKEIRIQNSIDTRFIHIPLNTQNILNHIKPDIIIAWEYNPVALICLSWSKMHRKKFIHLTDGTLYSERNIGIIQKLTRKIITKYADACIASSSKSKEKLMYWGVPSKKIFISILTMDTSKYKNLEKRTQSRRLLYVGSMAKRKGLDLLINAMADMKEDFNFHIVGNGTENEIYTLKQLAIKKGVIKKITWCGFKEGNALLDEYSQADLFVLPTREDCFGLVLLEAMCAKLPIITSKYADGAYDIVKHGINGYIVNPFDAKEFAAVLDKALLDSRIREGAAKANLTCFEFKNVAKGYLQAIEFVG